MAGHPIICDDDMRTWRRQIYYYIGNMGARLGCCPTQNPSRASAPNLDWVGMAFQIRFEYKMMHIRT